MWELPRFLAVEENYYLSFPQPTFPLIVHIPVGHFSSLGLSGLIVLSWGSLTRQLSNAGSIFLY